MTVLNHTANPSLYEKAVNRTGNESLLMKGNEFIGLLSKVRNEELEDNLFLAYLDALDIAEQNAFDKAAELQAAIIADELTAKSKSLN